MTEILINCSVTAKLKSESVSGFANLILSDSDPLCGYETLVIKQHE